MRGQLKSMGLSLDWSREFATCDVEYYAQQQRLFLDFLAAGLVARKTAKVNWDPVDQTVLANEQVIDGKGWRSGAPVEQRELTQWFFTISDYSEELLRALDGLDRWPEKVRLMQERWIGRSEGLRIRFEFASPPDSANEPPAPFLEIFTTRPDTLFGASFMAMAPDHPIAASLRRVRPEARRLHRGVPPHRHLGGGDRDGGEARLRHRPEGPPSADARPAAAPSTSPISSSWATAPARFSAAPRMTSATSISPANIRCRCCPSCCPTVPTRRAFAIADEAYLGDGRIINSGFLDGMTRGGGEGGRGRASSRASSVGNAPQASREVNYRLRDWGISRQRYWGCPIPMIHCPACGVVPVPRADLPVTLPDDVEFDRPGNPLDRHPTWRDVACPQCGGAARRETDTMDTFVDSSWYFARFTAPHARDADRPPRRRCLAPRRPIYRRRRARDPAPPLFALLHPRHEEDRACRPRRALRRHVHAGHGRARDLSRARTASGSSRQASASKAKATDRRAVSRESGEPVEIGPIEKMSKSKRNTVDPSDIIANYGADTARWFMLSDSPPERDVIWTEAGVEGAHRYVQRVWRLVSRLARGAAPSPPAAPGDVRRGGAGAAPAGASHHRRR